MSLPFVVRFDKHLAKFGTIKIVATGFTDAVLELADYAERSGSEVSAADLDIDNLQLVHKALEDISLAPFASLHLQEPGKFLASKTWIDAAFLLSRVGLQATLEHFKIAMSGGAKIVVTRNYATDSAWAVQFAKQQGWQIEHDDAGYSYLTRP